MGHQKHCWRDQGECRKLIRGDKASKKFEKMSKNFCRGYKQGGNLYAGYQFFLKGDSDFCDGYISENDIDDCEGHDCENGGRCVDGIGGYSCFCRRGYEGKRCEISHSEPSESSESSEVDLCDGWTAPGTCSADDIEMEAAGCWCDPETGPPTDLCAGWVAPDSCTELMMEMGSPGCYCDPETGPDLCAGWTAPGTCSADDIEMEAAGCWCDPETGPPEETGPPDLCADWVAPSTCTEHEIEIGQVGCLCDPETGETSFDY